jgi:DDE superfamily endonuclease/Helix-turn-helix of DDE superfamily endonuclease
MFTEQSLRDHPSLVKAFMGITAEQFWELIQQMSQRFPAYRRQQHSRAAHQRAFGAGRTYDLSLVLRTALVLTYLRLHIPQATVAALFGATQSDVSRELRRLLPLIEQCLPTPLVWEITDEAQLAAPEQLRLSDLAEGRVLIDATEQRVSRPHDPTVQKAYYSGKKQLHTLKTQFVTDGAHLIKAITSAVPGAKHDKALCDQARTLERLPSECEADADKGYQGLAAQVELVQVRKGDTSEMVPRLKVQTPFKKPKGGELSDEQKAFNRALGAIRIRVEHCIGWAKNWAILASRFRCDHTIYTSIMQTICGFVNAQTQRWQAAKANCA